MSDRIKYRLNSVKSQESVNTDTSLNINIVQSNRLLPSGDINRVLDIGEQFDSERRNNSKYRFTMTINGLFTNVLTDYNNLGTLLPNTDTLSYFGDNIFMTGGPIKFNNISDSIKYYVTDIDGWIGYYRPNWISNKLCDFVDLKPKREVFDLTPKNNIKNWDFYITYPYSIDDTHILVKDGLLINKVSTAIVNGKQLVLITTPVKHNVTRGDIVRINSIDYSIARIGDDNGDNIEYSFVINLLYINNTTIDENSKFKKITNGYESEYYFRKFKKLTNTNEYDIHPIAFSKNVYNDKQTQITFNKDIDISLYQDNLGRPLTDVYLTIIKKDTNYFTSIKSGIDTPFIGESSNNQNISDVRRLHGVNSWSIPSHTPIEDGLVDSNQLDEIYGDIVEYNRVKVVETVLGEVNHSFNRINRVQPSIGRPEGYFYKPHHKIHIRDWSTFVEQGDETTYNVPEYAEDLGDGRFLWRDYLDLGINDGQEDLLDYPFLNGCHYPYKNIVLSVKRQDPFNKYGLYYSLPPRDIFGDKTNYDNLIIKEVNNDSCA